MENSTKLKRGKLIAIEGIDGVGKNTQAKLLRDEIIKLKGECGFFSFPRYSSPTGILLGEYLNSGRNDLDLYGKAKLFSDDRLAAKDELYSFLDRGIDVVCDRYITSNVVYFEQFAEMHNPELVGVIGKDIEHNEFVINGIPMIDYLIVLSTSLKQYDTMMESKAKRTYTDQKLDQHESNKELIKGCHAKYNHEGAREHYDYGSTLIICDDSDGNILPIEEIQKLVMRTYISNCCFEDGISNHLS